jgi:hypothetical protein
VAVDRIAAIATTRSDVSLGFLESSQTFAQILAPPTRGEPRSRDLTPVEEPKPPPADSWTSALTALRIVRPD